jgi:hypothetical protein
MSSQDEVNANYQQYILYYCNHEQKDNTVYQIDLSDVCDVAYDSSPPYIVLLSNWQIGGYSAPDNSLLITYVLATVLTFFNNFYTVPQNIKDEQYYKISTSDLVSIRSDSSMIGYRVFNMTTQNTQEWNGSAWVNNNVSSSSSSVTDSQLVMWDGTTGKMVKTSGIDVSSLSKSACMIWSSDNVGVSMTANTVRLIPITGFAESVDLNSDFTPTTTTGLVTYTGSATKWFNVCCHYSLLNESPVSTQTFQAYISKNGSTTINGPRSIATFALTTVQYVSKSFRNIVQLATNDTVQLGGVYSATATLNFDDVSLSLEEI